MNEQLLTALREGKQITNGPQSIQWYPEYGDGRLWCDTPGCCNVDFDSVDEIIAWIGKDKDWEIAKEG